MNSQLGKKSIILFGGEDLSKEISNLSLEWYVFRDNITLLNMITNKVAINGNMFDALVMDRIGRYR